MVHFGKPVGAQKVLKPRIGRRASQGVDVPLDGRIPPVRSVIFQGLPKDNETPLAAAVDVGKVHRQLGFGTIEFGQDGRAADPEGNRASESHQSILLVFGESLQFF